MNDQNYLSLAQYAYQHNQTVTLYEFFYDKDGSFQQRSHEATVSKDRNPEHTRLWFKKKAGGRATVTHENLDSAKNGKYYSLECDPGKAKQALVEALKQRRETLIAQQNQITARLAQIEEAERRC